MSEEKKPRRITLTTLARMQGVNVSTVHRAVARGEYKTATQNPYSKRWHIDADEAKAKAKYIK